MRALRLFLLVTLVPACRSAGPERAPNALSEEERRAGWELLFDGRDTQGWRGYRQAACPAGWQAIDGALTRAGEGGDIVSEDEYQDFELAFEWRVAPGANSGLMFHVGEQREYPWETGPEFQILDNGAHPDGREPKTSAGSNYAMHAPRADVTHAPGEWNQARLIVLGPHVEHWLNGEKLLEYELWSDDWKSRVAACKWKDRPDYGTLKRGRIALQDHGDWVAFRNMRLKRLRPEGVGTK